MFLSTFDFFKIGLGPSSSHTMGPMVAAGRFLDELRASSAPVARLGASLHGSLAFTGKGHATDRALILGLVGCRPDTLNPDDAEALENEVRETGRVRPPGLPEMAFDPATDLVFDFGPPLPGHANGMILCAYDANGGPILERIYYSISGGFIAAPKELAAPRGDIPAASCPYPFRSAAEILEIGRVSGLSIAQMKRANEEAVSGLGLDIRLDAVWEAMDASGGARKKALKPARRLLIDKVRPRGRSAFGGPARCFGQSGRATTTRVGVARRLHWPKGSRRLPRRGCVTATVVSMSCSGERAGRSTPSGSTDSTRNWAFSCGTRCPSGGRGPSSGTTGVRPSERNLGDGLRS